MSSFQQQTHLRGYNYGAIFLHWLIAALIFIQLLSGFIMMRMPDISNGLRFSLFQWHKTFGFLVLALTLARIIWRLLNRPPHHAPMHRLELWTANFVTFAFYALMLAVPLLGWVVVSTSPTAIPTLFFKIPGLIWPNLPLQPDAVLEARSANAHMVLAYAFVFLLVLHIGGALKHVIIDRVAELSRILPNNRLPRTPSSTSSRIAAVAIVFLFIGGALIIGQRTIMMPSVSKTSASAANTDTSLDSTVAANWLVDTKTSTLGFTLDFSGAPKEGKAEHFQAAIYFEPDAPEKARADITVDSAAISYDDSYVAGSMHEADGLDSKNYPSVFIKLDDFAKSDEDFIAKGTMTIRNITLPIEVPFTFKETNRRAVVNGTAKIDRLAFNLGKQNDGNADWVGRIINIHFSVEATRINE